LPARSPAPGGRPLVAWPVGGPGPAASCRNRPGTDALTPQEKGLARVHFGGKHDQSSHHLGGPEPADGRLLQVPARRPLRWAGAPAGGRRPAARRPVRTERQSLPPVLERGPDALVPAHRVDALPAGTEGPVQRVL